VIDACKNGLNTEPGPKGKLTIGRCIFEDTRVPVNLDEKLSKYDVLLCASDWNYQLLAEKSRKPVWMIHEGVDTSLFCPGPRSGIMNPGRFYVYSAGKIEYRKGQDLTLKAFSIFAKRHPEAVLVTAWQSAWPGLSIGFKGVLSAPVMPQENGHLDVVRWATENGVSQDQIMDLGAIQNPMFPQILREMDCALFPSRAEACTNLPAKEAMAVGIPAIVGRNSGMVDVIGKDNCVVLETQRKCINPQGWGTDGWGESDVDEIVQHLENLFQSRNYRKTIGFNGAKWIHENRRTWKHHANELKGKILEQVEIKIAA
jgi:glycosyltransferase involved in cell wall biosynthesis